MTSKLVTSEKGLADHSKASEDHCSNQTHPMFFPIETSKESAVAFIYSGITLGTLLILGHSGRRIKGLPCM